MHVLVSVVNRVLSLFAKPNAQLPALPHVEAIEKLAPGVIRVLGCNPGPFTLQGTNTYIVGTGKRRLLIDTGQGVAAYPALLMGVLREQNCTVSDILLTHRHFDHIGGVTQLLPLLNHPKVWKKAPTPADVKALGGTVSPIEDNQTFSTEGATLQAVFTPGHTSDHVCFYLSEEASLFSGDCVLGCGTTTFDHYSSYMASLHLVLNTFPALTKIYPGHGPVVADGKAKIVEYITHRTKRENQILDALKSGGQMTPGQITAKVYGPIPWSLVLAARNNVLHHLEKLLSEGAVAKSSYMLIRTRWRLKT